MFGVHKLTSVANPSDVTEFPPKRLQNVLITDRVPAPSLENKDHKSLRPPEREGCRALNPLCRAVPCFLNNLEALIDRICPLEGHN